MIYKSQLILWKTSISKGDSRDIKDSETMRWEIYFMPQQPIYTPLQWVVTWANI